MNMIIDLVQIKQINKVSSNYLSDNNSWIFLPESVEYYISLDGKDFRELKKISNEFIEKDNAAFLHKFEIDPINASGRYLRVKANNIKVCPEWHKGAGEKAWLFADEISVE